MKKPCAKDEKGNVQSKQLHLHASNASTREQRQSWGSRPGSTETGRWSAEHSQGFPLLQRGQLEERAGMWFSHSDCSHGSPVQDALVYRKLNTGKSQRRQKDIDSLALPQMMQTDGQVGRA